MNIKDIDRDLLANECVSIIGKAVDTITIHAAANVGMDIDQPLWKKKSNVTRRIDAAVHEDCTARFKVMLNDKFGLRNVEVIGEETKKVQQLEPNYWQQFDLIISLDAVDGTDLLARGLGNWCTAVFLFEPKEKHILASFVGVPPGVVYYTCDNYKEAKKRNTEQHPSKFKEPVSVSLEKWRDESVNMESASICFYGARPNNLLSIFENRGFLEKLIKLKSGMEERGCFFRIYNLGGNPMMVNLADSKINAVIELVGQKLYDLVPGVNIARKAGAYLGDLEGKEITDDYFKTLLAKPQESTLSYILASTPTLYKELLECLHA